MNLKLQSAGKELATVSAQVSTLIVNSPLWIKLTIGGSLLVYVYIRRQWTVLNDCGIDVLTPKERISILAVFKRFNDSFENSK